MKQLILGAFALCAIAASAQQDSHSEFQTQSMRLSGEDYESASIDELCMNTSGVAAGKGSAAIAVRRDAVLDDLSSRLGGEEQRTLSVSDAAGRSMYEDLEGISLITATSSESDAMANIKLKGKGDIWIDADLDGRFDRAEQLFDEAKMLEFRSLVTEFQSRVYRLTVENDGSADIMSAQADIGYVASKSGED